MKKHLALFLVVVLGSVPAFGQTVDYAQELYGFGLIQGDPSGDLMAQKVLNRQEMMVILARLMGVEAAAGAFTLETTFTDVSRESYYAPYIAYAQGRGWTLGQPDGGFGPEEPLSARQAAAFLLRALGYVTGEDFEYDESLEFLQVPGMTRAEDFEDPLQIKRSEVFEMIYKALDMDTLNGETLGVILGIFEAPAPEEEPVTVIVTEDDQDESADEEERFVTVYGATTATTIEIHIEYQEAIAPDSVSLDTYSVGGGDYEVTFVDFGAENVIVLTVANPDGDDLEGEILSQNSPVRDLSGNAAGGLKATIAGEPLPD